MLLFEAVKRSGVSARPTWPRESWETRGVRVLLSHCWCVGVRNDVFFYLLALLELFVCQVGRNKSSNLDLQLGICSLCVNISLDWSLLGPRSSNRAKKRFWILSYDWNLIARLGSFSFRKTFLMTVYGSSNPFKNAGMDCFPFHHKSVLVKFQTSFENLETKITCPVVLFYGESQ